jgi:hypothetical protein
MADSEHRRLLTGYRYDSHGSESLLPDDSIGGTPQHHRFIVIPTNTTDSLLLLPGDSGTTDAVKRDWCACWSSCRPLHGVLGLTAPVAIIHTLSEPALFP